MAKEIIMPKFGMTQEEATIVKWLKQEGERVEMGDPLCEVTTDKINMEVEAPVDGILSGIRYPEGATVAVTEVIAAILAEGEAPPEKAPAAPEQPPAAPPAQPTPASAVQAGVEATPIARRMAEAEGVDLATVKGSGAGGKVTRQDIETFLAAKPAAPEGRPRATPAARQLARQQSLDLSAVKGSGPQGRIQGWDVKEAAAQKAAVESPRPPAAAAPAAPPIFPPAGQPQIIPLEGMRRTIAQRMQASAQQAPHILLTLDIDMSAAIAMRDLLNARYGGERPAISMTAVLVKACAAALLQHPMLNSYLREDKIYLMPALNIGVAVALEEGLIVPVVKNADQKSLYQTGLEVSDLSRRARSGQLHPEEVADGTFTISNLGMFGIDHFTAIINPPQAAILAVGRIARRFVPDASDRPVARSMMTVTLAADHRVVDGAQAARFLDTLRAILETAGAQWA